MTSPQISVIIPTYNRYESLKRTLKSLESQTYPVRSMEVIIIDDGSPDRTADVTSDSYPYEMQYLEQDNQGVVVARNHAAQSARGNVLIFLDDDIEIAPEFVDRMAQATGEKIVAVGNLRNAVRSDATWFERLQDKALLPAAPLANSGEISFADCLGGMFAVSRNDYFAAGGMQDIAQDGRGTWCDVAFGYRAWKNGCRFVHSLEAIGYHHDAAVKDFHSYCLRWKNAAHSAIYLFSKHPEIVSYLPVFRDKLPASFLHDSPRLLVRKALRAMTATRRVVWSIEWLAHRLEQHAPSLTLLPLVYRWIISSYIYQGYRQGLGDLALRGDRYAIARDDTR